ncbi:hypothetical protein ACLMAJ_36820 [Nocardia sp. KC 131]|uniref:hypothetical protein n=1 Tax=Nocardia arseniciresistens TaxID=3392119 RepID=UPI00398F86A3
MVHEVFEHLDADPGVGVTLGVGEPERVGNDRTAIERQRNMLLRPDGTVVVVDWAWPCRGAAWVDLVSLAPSIAASGIDPDPILATHPTTRDTDPAAISAFVCALTGYWTRKSRRPAPPRSPKLRRYQAHAAYVSTEWLSRRLGWQ